MSYWQKNQFSDHVIDKRQTQINIINLSYYLSE